MTEQDGGWDLDDDPAPDPPIKERIDWGAVTKALNEGSRIGAGSKPSLVEIADAAEAAGINPYDALYDEVVGAGLRGAEPDSPQQPETGVASEQESSDALTLFGSPDQFHVAWQHWNGMPEFHMDDLRPDSTLVVKFRTPEDREAFAKAIGKTVRKEEPRGIWYPEIVIAHFWDKRYRDAAAETIDNTPILSEADEPEDEADELTDEQRKQLAVIEEGSQA